jgi:pimeloyl-ACP methyl ester carboxylesterase
MRMIEWRQRADTHKFPRADLDDRDADIIVKMGDDRIRHAPAIRVLARARTIAGRDGDFQQGNFAAIPARSAVKKPKIATAFAARPLGSYGRAMPSFSNAGVEIAFLDEGQGEPIVLVHGFASNKETNWVRPGWVMTLTRAGRRVIALDLRGHGASAKLYDPAAYHSSIMADDVRALIEHLGFARADVMGYSLGSRITAFLATAHPGHVRSAVLGGLGNRLVEGVGLPGDIADALEAASLADVTDPIGYQFRAFAELTKSDLRALAACLRGSRQTLSRAELSRIVAPVLVAVGSADTIAGAPEPLAALIPGAQALSIPGRDHMMAVGDRVFKSAVIEFLGKRA